MLIASMFIAERAEELCFSFENSILYCACVIFTIAFGNASAFSILLSQLNEIVSPAHTPSSNMLSTLTLDDQHGQHPPYHKAEKLTKGYKDDRALRIFLELFCSLSMISGSVNVIPVDIYLFFLFFWLFARTKIITPFEVFLRKTKPCLQCFARE